MRVSPRGLRRGVITAVAATAGLAILTGCATHAPSDEIVLYYTSGDMEDKKFQECIQPGTSGSYPVNDEVFAIPTSVRTWNIAPEGGDTDKPIKSGSLPTTNPDGSTRAGPEVAVYATSDFFINTDCAGGKNSPLVKFWESLGRRYGISVDGDSGFKQEKFQDLLMNTLVPAEQKAIRQETRKYNVDVLDANLDDVWTTMERNLAPSFLNELNAKLGGDYFCGVGYNRGNKVSWTEWKATGQKNAKGQPTYEEVEKEGTCPPVRITIVDVQIANKGIAESRDRVYAAEQNAKADKIEAQSQADRATTLESAGNSPGYVRLQEIEAEKLAADACKTNPKCTVIIDQTGGASVNVGGR